MVYPSKRLKMYNRIKSKFCHFTICGLAVLCCTFLSSSAFAVDMSPNVHPIWTNATSDCNFSVYNGSSSTQEVFNNSQTFISIDNIYCTFPAGLSSKDTYAVISFMSDNIDNNDSLDAGFRAAKAQVTSNTNANYGVVGVDVSRFSNSSSRIDVYLYGEGQNNTSNATIVRLFNPNNSNEIFYLQPRERLSVSGYSFWVAEGDTNYTSAIGSISSKLDTLNNTQSEILTRLRYIREYTNSINSNVISIESKISDLKSLQQQANDDAQDRYDAEKQEESQREDSISESSDDAQSLFTFSVLNPFSGLFNLFKNDCSANIPIIASWLHAPSNVYTSWWCPIESQYGIRSYLTPVFGIASMMLLFGFVIRWLSNNSGDIYGARNFNKEING